MDNIIQLSSICVTISMIKGVLQWINHFINEDKTHTIDFAKLQVVLLIYQKFVRIKSTKDTDDKLSRIIMD